MTSNTYKSLRPFFFLMFSVSAFALGFISYATGQTVSEKVEQVEQQVQGNAVQIDATTATAIGGTAAAAIAVVKGLLDQRTNTRRDRTTDVDAGRFIILMSKFYQAKYLYPHMTDKEILDLPISNNPMSKMTLGQAITTEADLWANGNQTYWGIPSPQMSVPTQTTVSAIKSAKEEYPTVVAVTDSQTVKEAKAETQKPTPPAPPTPPSNTTVGK